MDKNIKEQRTFDLGNNTPDKCGETNPKGREMRQPSRLSEDERQHNFNLHSSEDGAFERPLQVFYSPYASADNDNTSIMQSPLLEGIALNRKTSLKSELPRSASTPPTTNSSSFAGSPFADNKNNTLLMDEVIREGQEDDFKTSPFSDNHQFEGVEERLDKVKEEGSYNDSPTVYKRNRWGTTRNSKRRPQIPAARSGTVKRFLQDNGNMVRKASMITKNLSIKKRNNDDDDNDEYGNNVVAKNLKNRKGEHRTIVFNKSLPEELIDPETGRINVFYPRNKIRTTKYTPLSFLPKNILNQFRQNVANVYFLVLIILGAFKIFGVPQPVLSAVPLIVIVLITAIRDAVEDSRRTISDWEVNNQTTHILSNHPVNTSDEYRYENFNINDEKVSLWKKFKKANSRVLFKFIAFCQRKLREKDAAVKNKPTFDLPRKSIDSDLFAKRYSRPDSTAFINEAQKSVNLSRASLGDAPKKRLRFVRKHWKDVRVGDILRLQNDEEIPADIVILSTSDEDNACYVETKNLDGETNLKVKQALKYGKEPHNIVKGNDFCSRKFQVKSEGPHPNLYSYEGTLEYFNQKEEFEQEPININNLLLRGCTLRNTKWVVGIVTFTGDDSKIMLNAGITPTKQSRISRELNYYVLLNFILLFIICFVSALINGIWYNTNHTSRDYFENGTIAGTPALNGLVEFFVSLILYQTLVPISLYITIEIIKSAQAAFIYGDVEMYYPRLDYPCTPKSWNISDDLGQIEYVFSDKTGTLTQNVMEFKKCTINGVTYGKAYTEALAGLRRRQGVDVETEAVVESEKISQDRDQMIKCLRSLSSNCAIYEDELTFVSSDFVEHLVGDHDQKRHNINFMMALALCHSVIVDEDPNNSEKQIIKAQSPDEAALVLTARALGFIFEGNTKKGVLVDFHGKKKEFELLTTLEFNSSRRRMSTLLKLKSTNPGDSDKVLLICKGADSVIYERLLPKLNDPSLVETTSEHLRQFATEGLRTLGIAQREISWDEYETWSRKHVAAASSLHDRETKMEITADEIERNLTLLGGTAIEDKLQDGVPESINVLSNAGMKIWVLTGDKVETAINIGFSCNLLGNDMEILVIKPNLNDKEQLELGQSMIGLSELEIVDTQIQISLEKYFGMEGSEGELEKAQKEHFLPRGNFGLVIDGAALRLALDNSDTKRKLLLLCKQCKAVLCCRVSPSQKAAVVQMVKDSLDVMTLAIGDGSNDVAMIQAANVGVGIAGEEGRQAVMSSDYGLGQFRFLTRLLLTHGRWSYRRFSEMIPSFFYKNIIFSFTLFWYGIYDNFDGSYLYDYSYVTLYNLAFTSLPVILLGIFDQDVPAKVALLVPQLYYSGILRTDWTETKFWIYMIDGLYQSAIAFFYPLALYRTGFISITGMPLHHRFYMGVMVIAVSVISCNFYVMLHQYRWDWLSFLIVVLSILIVYGWTGIYTSFVASAEFFEAASRVLGTCAAWTCIFSGILASLIPHFSFTFVTKFFNPTDVDIIRECYIRGDFDDYPDNYDPTDPNRQSVPLQKSLWQMPASPTASGSRLSSKLPVLSRKPMKAWVKSSLPDESAESLQTEVIDLVDFSKAYKRVSIISASKKDSSPV